MTLFKILSTFYAIFEKLINEYFFEYSLRKWPMIQVQKYSCPPTPQWVNIIAKFKLYVTYYYYKYAFVKF